LLPILICAVSSFTTLFSYSHDNVPIQSITKQFIASLLPTNPIVVEAGAFNGSDTHKMSRLWPHGTIHAFEPVPKIFKHLKKRFMRTSNVRCYPYALGNITGESSMHVSYSQYQPYQPFASSSLLSPKEHLKKYPHITFPETIAVKVFTLDDWAAQEGILNIDLLWLDMQGMELDMLKASPNMLRTVKVIYMEVSHQEMYEGAPLYNEVKEWLEAHNFSAIMQDASGIMNNVLFVRQDIIPCHA